MEEEHPVESAMLDELEVQTMKLVSARPPRQLLARRYLSFHDPR